MNPLRDLPGLQVQFNLVTEEALNFRPDQWPPRPDFPIVLDAAGNIVSIYSDSSWDLSPWEGAALSINFGDGERGTGAQVSPKNAALFRQVMIWLIYGPGALRTARAIKGAHAGLKHLFAVATEGNIKASELSRFPKLIENLAARVPSTVANSLFSRLHRLWMARESLGFTLLDESGLKYFSSLLPEEETSEQSAYIPPRIWSYQVARLKECLDDYVAHEDKIKECYEFCLEAYRHNAGSLKNAFLNKNPRVNPFNNINNGLGGKNGRKYYGTFRLTAEKFGIDKLLDRWVDFSDRKGVGSLSQYLTLVTKVGHAYCLNFSLMRRAEGARLRADCYMTERVDAGEDVHLLRAATTKMIQDPNALWIVSPTVEVAIHAMTHVVLLRMQAARDDPRDAMGAADLENPMLLASFNEPWKCSQGKPGRPSVSSYAAWVESMPKLFDPARLCITESDLSLANMMTFGLDPGRFAVGKVWPISYHQLRRTGAVNMLSTGLVSEASLQYQLKQASRAMTRYYGQNWYKLTGTLDEDARGLYLREMYQAVAREFASLQDEVFVSPYGEKRKVQILSPVTEKDHESLVRDGEAGRISYRRNLFGACTKPGEPCPFGGFSNLLSCLGCGNEKPCEHVLCDKSADAQARVAKIQAAVVDHITQAERGSPGLAALEHTLEATERYFDVVNDR